jgi:c(7)-type cytochrome triheme protein
VDLIRTVLHKTGNSALKSALFSFIILFSISCSHSTRSLFFDIPPPEPETEPAQPQADTGPSASQLVDGAQFVHPHDLEKDRPPLENILVWEEALKLLPKDKKGNADWVKAQKDGTIKPRAMNPRDRNGDSFHLDFYLRNDKPKFEAYFPHSAHVALIGCDSCHPAVFRYRDNEITMKTMRKGENCGACHGSVAFSTKNCKRCHTSM